MTFVGSVHRIAIALAVGVGLAAMQSPAFAQAARPNGYPITNVNLRAGPGTYYPVIVVVPSRAPIRIVGCLGDYTWCDVLFQGNRGWMRSIYLEGWYRGYYYSLRDYAPRLGYAVVSFDIGRYWDSNYRERPFYRDRGKWGGSGGSYGEGWTDRANFYSRLEPYGDWIWLQGQYVWVPENVGPRWRPYTVGRWAYTERYGWMWVSREPFGWATYHYGRWGFSNRVGWFWVPGSRWAPAWVSWRRSDDYLAWAPLPPTADEGLSINITVGNIPDYYWQVVPDRDFLSDDLPERIVRDRNRYDPILRRSESLGNVTVVNNNVVVNNVVNLNYVEQKTKKKVVVHKVERTKDESKAKGGKAEGASIEVFEPPAEPESKTGAPRKPKRIEEVAKESKTKEQAEGAPSTEELLVPAEIKKPLEAEAEAKPVAPLPPAEGETPPAAVTEEAAPPPPPPPPAEEAAPPPPAAPAEEATPPTKPAEEAPPPPPPAEEAPPPSPPAKEAVPPPPPVEEAAPPPPPPPPPAEETEPKGKQDGKPKREKGEKAKPEETPAPPPPPPPPPPQEETPTPPPPVSEEAPKPKRDGRPKFNKDKGETGESFVPPPPPPEEMAPPPAPVPPVEGAGPKMKRDGKPRKDKGGPPAESCPEGMVPLEDGSCGPTQ